MGSGNLGSLEEQQLRPIPPHPCLLLKDGAFPETEELTRVLYGVFFDFQSSYKTLGFNVAISNKTCY